MRDVPYRYVGAHLLERPFHYMYTPFEGGPFLEAWRAERGRFRDALRELGARPLSVTVPDRPLGVLSQPPGSAPIETRDVLVDLASAEVHRPAEQPALRRAWVAALTKKFEVTKRLHGHYGERLRPSGDDWAEPEPYALFAAVVGLRYVNSQDLRRLNTLLKLVDLLASLERMSTSPLAISCAHAAVELEMDAVDALMRKHAVAIAC